MKDRLFSNGMLSTRVSHLFSLLTVLTLVALMEVPVVLENISALVCFQFFVNSSIVVQNKAKNRDCKCPIAAFILCM